MSHPLAEQATRGLTDATSTRERSRCQQWARQQYEAVYGDIFHGDNPATATDAAWFWSQTKYAHGGGGWGAIGDLLYWFGTPSQPEGHVVIRIPGNKIAENSVVHFLWDGDGRGTRAIKNLPRTPDLIVRLPRSVTTAKRR